MNIVAVEPIGIKEDKYRELKEKFQNLGHNFLMFPDRQESDEILIERLKDAEIAIISNIKLTKDVMSHCPKLKMLSVAFTGVDHVDLKACSEKGVKVSNAAGYSNQSVAELVIGMIISKLRNIVECNEVIREGKTKDGLVGYELAGKTVGIVGTGAIGLRVAKLLKAFGCKLLGNNNSPSKEGEDLGIEYVSLDELLKASDIVTLHTPLTEATTHLINSENIKLLKPTALLVNCARGPVVDIEAVATALKEKKFAGAAIDVFEIEPPLATDHVLFGAESALLTPHIAFATAESMVKRAGITFDNIYTWMDGKQINTIL